MVYYGAHSYIEPEAIPTPAPHGPSGGYLTFRNGTVTKVFLVDSQLSYAENDSVVVISGEIRNDYSWQYYFPITGDLYTFGGEKIEGQYGFLPVQSANSQWPERLQTVPAPLSCGSSMRAEISNVTTYSSWQL